jgi:hypothetical protein
MKAVVGDMKAVVVVDMVAAGEGLILDLMMWVVEVLILDLMR